MTKHFTATLYIVARVDGEPKLLLHKHKKLGLWLAMGGHVEADENMMEAALREGREESGLEDIQILYRPRKLLKTTSVEEFIAPFTLLEELIPAYADTPEHIHMDCIYLGYTCQPEKVQMHDSSECRWYTAKDLDQPEIAPEVQSIGKAALQAYMELVQRIESSVGDTILV